MGYVYLVAALALNIGANISMKLAALRGIDLSLWHSPADFLAKNWLAIAAIALYGINALFYFLALREVPLIIAYPTIIFIGFISIHMFAVMALGERIVFWQIIGHILVLAGMALILFFVEKNNS